MSNIDEDREHEIKRNPESALAEATITMSELRRLKSNHVYVINTSDFDGTEKTPIRGGIRSILA